jgi:phosphoribosylaminoimidazole-succinocarboxamide synthase
MEQFKQYAGQIREMAETVQETTFDTYAQIGRLNADGKIEVGLNAKKELVLGDELELDSLRNMSLKNTEIENKKGNIIYTTEGELLGMNLHELIPG